MSKRIKVLSVALSVAVVAVVAVVGMTLRAGPAHAATSYWWVCDNSVSNRCAQLDHNTYTAGEPVILNVPSTSDLSFAWYRQQQDVVSAGAGFPFTGQYASPLNTYYNGDAVVQIFKHTSSGHDGCMGINGNALPQVGWEPCGSSSAGVPNTTVWIYHVPDSSHPNIGYLVNVGWTQHISDGDRATTKTLLSVGYSSPGVCDDNIGSALQVERQAPDPTSCNREWFFWAH